MARKSRKNISNIDTNEVKEERFYYLTAIYARLSIENSGYDNNDSIENQINICKEYLKKHEDLKLYEIYQDNGEKGTNFDRPAFQKLMNDIKEKKVTCIIVKDLSRFGRNYIETGEYLEKIFPFLGVRFIAVTDAYDSEVSSMEDKTLVVPLKNMINEMYAKDLSQKIITSFKAKQEKGEFLPAFPPYGYIKSKEKNKYEIDSKTAPYVKMIFEWKAEGISHSEICNRLNELGAIPPVGRKIELGLWKPKKNQNNRWNRISIRQIMKNPTYTGKLVYGRVKNSLYEGVKSKKTKEEDWIVIPNMHEPIISEELFNEVQDIFKKNHENFSTKTENSYESRTKIINLFHRKIYCEKCGKRMSFVRKPNKYTKEYTYEYAYFECSLYPHKMCTAHRIRYLTLYNVVLSTIQHLVITSCNQENLLQQFKENFPESNLLNNDSKNINELTSELKKIEIKRTQIFEHFVEGLLNEQEYLFIKHTYEEKTNRLQQKLTEIKNNNEMIESVLLGKNNWQIILHNLESLEELNQSTVDCLIKKIIVYENNRINIEFNYKNERASFENVLKNFNLIKGEKSDD